MRKIKVYLDTSVISYLPQEDSPERMKDTLELWKDFENNPWGQSNYKSGGLQRNRHY